MSKPDRIAVLDIGKTNVKVVIVDCSTGRELAERRMQNHVLAGPPYPHHDIEALWTFFLETLADFVVRPGFEAISITAHGASLVLLDADGRLALPVLDYEHRYPQDVQDSYAAIRPPFSETLSPVLSGGLNAGAQLHYQKTSFPAEFARVRTILTYPQYWAFRLTGVAATEITSLGCHTDLWNPSTGGYSTLVDSLGIRSLMAPRRSAFDILGLVLPDIARKLQLAHPVPVHCGIHDSNASLLPHLMQREAPFAVVSTGTWVVNFAVGSGIAALDQARDTLANMDAYGRAVPSSRFMGGREFALLAAEIGGLDGEPAITDALRKQVMVFPDAVTGSGPFPGHERRWINADTATIQELHGAACLYLALMTETCLDLIAARGHVIVEGPFAANQTYLQLLASLTGREVKAICGATGTSQGAALLAGIAPSRPTEQRFQPEPTPVLASYRAAWNVAMRDRPAISP